MNHESAQARAGARRVRIQGSRFKDEQGRTLILRGVNLGGSSKVPTRPDGATYLREGFYDHRDVSFVGRPFPLDEANEHFSRLRRWGFTFLRFLVTWEAIEHAGPGIYDEEYLDYVVEIVRRAGEHGIDLFVDPHQDVWGRLSGGDGAPGWTFEAVGMEPAHFAETGAALVHCEHGDPLPPMIWPTNHTRLAAATMFTLFFGGNDFAPRTRVEGEPVQEFLQRHYVDAVKQVALRLRGLPNVVGYDTMNEPSPGLIGWARLDEMPGDALRVGDSPTPFQAMLLGAGFPRQVEVWEAGLAGMRRRGSRLVNAGGARAWQEGRGCVWRENGVWDVGGDGEPQLLRPGHFARVGGRPVEFDDYLRPFINRYARAIRSVDPDALLFVEARPGTSSLHWGPEDAGDVVNAAHWYDGITVFTRNHVPWLGVEFPTSRLVLGPRRVRRSFVEQLARLKRWGVEQMGGAPTLIGEFGIPFDLRRGRAYRTGDFSSQVRALDASFRALEANLLSGTLWNYTADNDNRRGDQWNGEDFSIFSRDQQDDPGDPDSGGRALRAAVRPYARCVAGEPLRMRFDVRRRVFDFEFRHDPAVDAPTEVFVPALQYPEGCRVEVSDGSYALDREAQTLAYRHGAGRDVHVVRLKPR